MLTMFHGLHGMLPPLRDYHVETFTKQTRYLVGRGTGAKVMPHCIARKRLFNPVDKTDRDTDSRLVELVGVVVPAIIAEMLNPRKRAWHNLSRSGKPESYGGCGGNYLLGFKATNDPCESLLGGVKGQIEK